MAERYTGMSKHTLSQDFCVLGFDYGSKKIGVAVGQSITGQATPLEVIPARQQKPDWGRIEKLIKTWQPRYLIVGIPWREDASASPVTAAAQRFSRQLEGRFNVTTKTINEYLSSYEAAERVGSKSQPLDAWAAQVILETWFGEQGA